MATISFYDNCRKLFANGEVDLTTLKVMLRDASTVFNAAHTVPANLAGSEVSGNGWTVGGEAVASAAITVVDTNEAMLDGTDISKTATGGNIGPASSAVLIADNFASPPVTNLLWFIDFEGAEEAGVGTDFNVNWNASGIARWNVPA